MSVEGRKYNIIVFNTAANSSGAMAELHRFMTETATAFSGLVNWFYVLGLADLPETPGVRILRFSWTKRNWLFRLFFDLVKSPILVRELNADFVISLQNTNVNCGKVPQILYVQLCFPFIKHRFPFREFRLWLHQNLVGALSIRSIKKADLVVVQNDWMKKSCLEKTRVSESKILVLKQNFNKPAILKRFIPTDQSRRIFFYPATSKSYKNHQVILDGVAIARQKSSVAPSLVFTLRGDEYIGAVKLKDAVAANGLIAKFCGVMPRDDIFQMYSQSVLVFPSLLETVGLPLVEAKAVGCIILAYDAEYSRDVLKNYSDVHYFTDAQSLAVLILECMEGKLAYFGGLDSKSPEGKRWDEILEVFARSKIKRITV